MQMYMRKSIWSLPDLLYFFLFGSHLDALRQAKTRTGLGFVKKVNFFLIKCLFFFECIVIVFCELRGVHE